MPDLETRIVHWYDCDCDWITKYCDEYHRKTARVPLSILRAFEQGYVL